MIKSIFRFACAALVLMGAARAVAQAPQPQNRIVVIIDMSGSFKKRCAEAIERTGILLENLADVKLKRWEPETDVITLISLDAMPEVVWKGTLPELKALDRKAWEAKFATRTDYVQCTDVTRAFELAARELQGDGKYVSKYLFAFSDLIHEPPTTSLCDCAAINRTTPVPPDFPWDSLRECSVSVFWVPGEQKFHWSKAIVQQGMEGNFHMYGSESEAVEIAQPPRPIVKENAEEKEARREQVIGVGKGALKLALWIIGGVVVLSVLAAAGQFLPRRRSPASHSPRPVLPTPRKPNRPHRPNTHRNSR